jgi:demethylmenaquinone methyltransferase / 2-methoxy-6-polyprenyl-1,4-benzoquinol methylase
MPRQRAADSATTHFGAATVPAADKPALVRGVFDRVAGRYDLMNDMMSLGLHRVWKSALVDRLRPRPGLTHLDLAGGTGDVARAVLAAAAGRGRVVIADINARMLAAGAAADGIARTAGDGEALPFAAQSFDSASVAFGLRNMTHIDRALAEVYRVLKPGGRFICLEFSRVEAPLVHALYDAYSRRVIPRLGALVAKDRAAYEYLIESIRRFPPQAEFARMMRAAGFARVDARNLSFGIVALHSGWRL